MSEPIPENPQEPQPKKPDIGMLSLIIGICVSGILFLLPMNHLEINWMWSALVYAIFIIGIVWTFLSHGIPHCRKSVKITVASVMVIFFGFLASLGVHREYVFQHSPTPIPPADPKLFGLVNGLVTNYNGLENILASNKSDPRLAVLDLKQEAFSNQGTEQQKSRQQLEHTLENQPPSNLDDIRTARENLLSNSAAQEIRQRQQEEVQKQIDEVKNEGIAAEDAKNKKSSDDVQKRADEELVKIKKILGRQILPMFDYLITQLASQLANISKGQEMSSDFPGTPTVYNSDLSSDGIIICGTNYIRLGTNSAWKFDISTTASPIQARGFAGSFPGGSGLMVSLNYSDPAYATISLSSQTVNEKSALTIGLIRSHGLDWNSDAGYRDMPTENSQFYDQISVNLNVPNITNLNINETAPFDNYKTEINKALIHLIGAQDKESPLRGNATP